LTDVGSFWKKTKDGKTYLSGQVRIGDQTYNAFVFTNQKKKDTHPDYRLTISNLPEDMKPPAFGGGGASTTSAKPSAKPATKKAAPKAPEPAEDTDDTDIPF
jgi:hypothetical protein